MYKIKLDSLKLRIDLRHVKIIDKDLKDEFSLINITTGEIPMDEQEADKTFKRTRKRFNKFGCKYEFVLKKFQFAGVVNDYLIINLHSKMRGPKMLNGIEHDGLKQIYQDLIDLKVAYFDYYTFLNWSRVTDADFFLDYKSEEKEFKDFVGKMKSLTPLTRERDRGYKEYDGGIEWNTRRGAGSSNPYMKCYSKEPEMRKRFGRYLHHYITEEELSNRRRFEFTIKNAAHFRSFGIKDFSLNAVVNIGQSHRLKMMQGVANKNLTFQYPLQIKLGGEENLRPKEIYHLNVLQHIHQKSDGFGEIVKNLTATMDKKNRYAYKKQLEVLYSRFIAKVNVRDVFIGKNPVLSLIMPLI